MKNRKLSWGAPDGADRSVSSSEYDSCSGEILGIQENIKYAKRVQNFRKSGKLRIYPDFCIKNIYPGPLTPIGRSREYGKRELPHVTIIIVGATLA